MAIKEYPPAQDEDNETLAEKLQEKELEEKKKEDSAKPELMGSKLDPMKAIKDAQKESVKTLDYIKPMEEMGLPFGKEKDKIEKEIWKLAQDPESQKIASDTMKDLAEWTLTGFDVKKLHSSNEQVDKLLSPIRTIDKYKDKAEN